MIIRFSNVFAALACVLLGVSAANAQAPAAPPAAPAATTPPVPEGPAPHIKFDATELNLGDVVRGQDAVATFTYQNTGTAPLHILSAKPG